jgi:hypothetical protein
MSAVFLESVRSGLNTFARLPAAAMFRRIACRTTGMGLIVFLHRLCGTEPK